MSTTSPQRASLRSRMGNAMRRTSSILSITRPTTPSAHSENGSVKSLDAPSQLVLPAHPTPDAPSPIAESPAREAAETPALTAPAASHGPSPLQAAVVHDEPEEMHPHEAQDEVAPKSEASATVEEPSTVPEVEKPKVEEEPARAESIRAPQEADKVSISTQVNLEDEPIVPAPSDASEDLSIQSPPPPPAPHAMANASSYFDEVVPPQPKVESIPDEDASDTALSSQTTPRAVVVAETNQSFSSLPAPEEHRDPAPAPMYNVPSASVWGGSSENGSTDFYGKPSSTNGDAHHDDASVRMPVENPFADPVPPITVTDVEGEMPRPQVIEREESQQEPPIVLMPLPAVEDVIAQRSLHGTPSAHSLAQSREPVNTDESQPLLSRPPASYLDSHTPTRVNVSPQSANPPTAVWVVPAPSPLTAPRLHELGWIEYLLPDGSVYYVHPTLRVTTDIDLRNSKKLNIVTAFFGRYKDGGAPVGLELWLCEKSDRKKRDTALEEWWVDHTKRRVSNEKPREGGDSVIRPKVKGADDALDMEYRYWSFMESHPAHVAIPSHIRSEAMDVLTWAWTERLLPSQRSVPAPFSQEECQELMALVRSFTDNQSNNSTQGVIQTRIIARILLRLVYWRQGNFRPEKALPKLPSGNSPFVPARPSPIRRALVDFCISCLCLGIPSLFYNRSHFHRLDEESGIRGAGSMLIIGACTCLVAAMVLSASVTFLSLPGLDNIARVAGLVAVLFSTFSMASTVVALFKYKADAERAVSVVGSEGLLIITRRHVVFSLPLVFLSYAVIGFITGLVLYSFRGSTPGVLERRFHEYTGWTVVGLLGALLGVLTTSVLLMRR